MNFADIRDETKQPDKMAQLGLSRKILVDFFPIDRRTIRDRFD